MTDQRVKAIAGFNQVSVLLDGGAVEEALDLAAGAQLRGGVQEQVDRVRQQAGFKFLEMADFDRAKEVLIQGKVK